MTTEYVRAYRGNPLIECLGPIKSAQEWIECLNDLPPISDEEREAPPQYRLHSTSDLMRVFVARRDVVELALHLELMLRQSYVNRNPLTNERTQLLNALPNSEDEMHRLVAEAENKQIVSSTLIGYTGVGKSVSTSSILKQFPQKIYHQELGLTQVAWLKVEMPSDGGIKQLFNCFRHELTKLLGQELPFEIPDSTSTTKLLIHMARLCAIYSIGLLVIDEVQNLTVRRGANRESLLNVLQTICNTVNVSLFMIGTMKAQRLFVREARHARRAMAYGCFVWTRMNESSGDWAIMLETLWNYQWTAKKSELTQEVRDYIYEATQGLMALLPLMLMSAQIRAIVSKQEEVTVKTLEWVYKQRFQPIHAVINALRTNDIQKLVEFEDLWMLEMYETIMKEQSYAENVAITAFKPKQKLPPRRKAAIELASTGFPLALIDSAIDQAVAMGKKTTAQIVSAARFILEDIKPESVRDPDDIRNTLGNSE